MVQPVSGAPGRIQDDDFDSDVARSRLSPASSSIRKVEAQQARVLARVVEYSPITKIVPALTTTSQRIQGKLDEYRAMASGPYFAEGQTISAPPHFRMNGGRNQTAVKSHLEELDKICALARPRPVPTKRLEMVVQGRGTATELVAVTQALIDAGKLPPGKPEDLSLRIHRLQWEWGLGFDCAGYTQEAFLHSRGGTRASFGLVDALNEPLLGLSKRAAFMDVGHTSARPGDIFALDPGAGDTVGHVVIVRTHEMLSSQEAGDLRLKSDQTMRSFLAGGPIHRYEVDSSWGAGQGGDWGGFRRDTWLYNESTHEWGFMQHFTDSRGVESTVFDRSKVGPCNHPVNGVFRPKSEV